MSQQHNAHVAEYFRFFFRNAPGRYVPDYGKRGPLNFVFATGNINPLRDDGRRYWVVKS